MTLTSMKERIGEVGSSQVKHFGTFLIPERKILSFLWWIFSKDFPCQKRFLFLEGRRIAEALFIIFIPAKAAEAGLLLDVTELHCGGPDISLRGLVQKIVELVFSCE